MNIIKLLKGLVNHFTKEKPIQKTKNGPYIIPRAGHPISRSNINRNALKVLYRLNEAGYGAYLVGGCVRDLLLGYKPKDFDIATNALPEDIRKLFKNCRLIGKRFRLAHILFGKEIIEVATFRTHHENAPHEHHRKSQHGMILRDNMYGTIEDDVWRRDFRMNALYYNISDYSIVDYVGGLDDIQNRMLNMIGEPEQRFHEDPVRLLRAIRLTAKLNITIHPQTEEPIRKLHYLLEHVSSARLFQEVLKIFQEGFTLNTIHLLQKYNLFSQLFPATGSTLNSPHAKELLAVALASTDHRIKEGKTVSPAFLFAVLLWHPFVKHISQLENKKLPTFIAYEKALQIVMKEQTERLAIPRIMQIAIREICILQYRLTQRRANQVHRLLEHPRFRAAYDLLLLRAHSGEPITEFSNWWTKYYSADNTGKLLLLKELSSTTHSKKRRRKKVKKIKQME
ncbi:MAG: polynucleotide adenylyltransferase PcnB [Gammaproteobacteria bacterium]|nr:polynucleotide adenylyltransferase PcnB [Gammaproteobacteria bacterium]